MNPHYLRYLRVLYRHLTGPLSRLATDPASRHQLKAVAGVMARLVVNIKNEPAKLLLLRKSALDSLPELEAIIGESVELAELRTRLTNPASTLVDYEMAIAQVVRRLGHLPILNSESLLQRFVNADWTGWNQVENDQAELSGQGSMAMDAAAGNALLGRESALTAWLREQCGESANLEIAELTLVPGGYSKQTVFAKLRHSRTTPEEIVLRLDRPESPLQTTVVAEYPLLKVLHEAGVRVPRPLALDLASVVGAPLMAVERLPGRIVADGQHFHDSDIPFSCAQSLAREMAIYHRIPLDRLPPDLAGMTLSVPEQMTQELKSFREIWTACGHESIVVEAAFNWLSEHLQLAGEARSLVHGDLRFHNVLIDAGEVSAILDWEIAAVGHPAFDLGYVYRHVIQLGSWQAFLNAYEEAGGEIPSADTLNFYALRTELFIVVHLTRMAAGFQAGTFEKIDLGYAALELRQHAVFLLAERLRATLAGKAL
jgi:aminoglycoside phosphotransferase (APT) family kinase protein